MRMMDVQFVVLVNVAVTPPSIPDFGEQEDIRGHTMLKDKLESTNGAYLST